MRLQKAPGQGEVLAHDGPQVDGDLRALHAVDVEQSALFIQDGQVLLGAVFPAH